MSGHWIISDDGQTHWLSRSGAPRRWDVDVGRRWHGAPALDGRGRRRLARSLRQDIWRALRDVRGFVPMIAVTATAGHLRIRVGGTLMAGGAAGRNAAALVDEILDNPEHQRRWLSYATRPQRGSGACSKRS